MSTTPKDTAHLIAAAENALEALENLRDGGRQSNLGMLAEDLRAGLERAAGADSVDGLRCGGCSGRAVGSTRHERAGVTVATVAKCSDCGGLLGTFASVEDLQECAGLELVFDASDVPADRTRYFDVDVDGERSHGFFNPATGRVTQFG